MNTIYTRVSIRKYQDKPVEKEKTEAILRAAMQAPSAVNQQPWEFYVVTAKEKLEALSQVSPYAGMTKNAPAAIVSVYRKDCRVPIYAQIDMSIAMENSGCAPSRRFSISPIPCGRLRSSLTVIPQRRGRSRIGSMKAASTMWTAEQLVYII